MWVTVGFMGKSSKLLATAMENALSHRCKHLFSNAHSFDKIFEKSIGSLFMSSPACAVLPKTRILTSSKPCVQWYRMGTHTNGTNSSSFL